jgi:hypothetical protein
VPKLRKKLQSRRAGPGPSDSQQGSDSGISMSSQETREPVPWLGPPGPRPGGQDPPGAPAARTAPGSARGDSSRHSVSLAEPAGRAQWPGGGRPRSMVAAPRPRPGPGLLLGRPGEEGPEDRLQCENRLSEEEPGPTASDIANLPFSMPKLARRLAAAPGPGLLHPKRPSSGLELGFSGAVAAGGPATRQEPSAKYCRQARPRSLGEPPPGALGLALPLHRPGGSGGREAGLKGPAGGAAV